MNLLFATSNTNKVTEIKAAFPAHFSLLSLRDTDAHNIEIDEPYETIEKNAVHKAVSYSKICNVNCFSEDTGLEVLSLNGAPGVRSARFAGEPSDTQKNIDLLLQKMEGEKDRRARFRTVIALVMNNQIYTFEGVCKGAIILERRGHQGFGYDPVFVPEGSDITFAEMNTEGKNMFSHRKKALEKMLLFLRNYN